MLQFTWDSSCGPPISVDGMVVHTVQDIWIAMGWMQIWEAAIWK